MKKMGLTFIYLWLISLCSCQKELIEYEKGDVKICIEQGEQWLHDFPLFLGINKKNPPQIAIWLEDTQGNYLSTVYVTHKIATQSWQASGGNRRKEALEINHSTDFNEAFPKSAKDGEANYSGGKEGSGQPAIVYAANVDLSKSEKSFEANLMGHSSPDGSSGEVNKDTSGLTTALHIVKRITVIIQ